MLDKFQVKNYGFIPLSNVRNVRISPFRAILCIVWSSWIIIGIITFIHVVYVLEGFITRKNHLLSLSKLLYTSKVQ